MTECVVYDGEMITSFDLARLLLDCPGWVFLKDGPVNCVKFESGANEPFVTLECKSAPVTRTMAEKLHELNEAFCRAAIAKDWYAIWVAINSLNAIKHCV